MNDLSNSKNDQSPDDAMQWTAFQYLLGELPADQVVTFETKLADSEDAQQALVSAVELIQQLRAVDVDDLPVPRPAAEAEFVRERASAKDANWSTRESRKWPMTIALVAVVVVSGVVAIAFWMQQQRGQQSIADEGPQPTEQVANIWVTSMDQIDENIEDEIQTTVAVYEYEHYFNLEDDTPAERAGNESDWLINALQEIGGAMPSGNSMFH